MIKAYKYRIYPNCDQREMIDRTIDACRLVYNLGLEVKMRAYKEHGRQVSNYDLHKQVCGLRADFAWISSVNSQALYASLNNLEKSFKSFFNGHGFPNFKSKREEGSFNCPTNKRKIDWDNNTLTVSKIEEIPIVLSRKFTGKIKTVTISRTSTNKYFASILVEDGVELPSIKDHKEAIGIDLGISNFAILSTGEKIPNPRHLQGELRRLKVLQRRLSRKKKGGQNRKKTALKIALLHEKITNKRQDFLHKLSSRFIGDNQTDTICIEDLAVKNMVKNHKLAQAISDASWSEFVRQLEYKGKWYGKNVIKINRFYASSKTCSNCGHKKDEMNLSERSWQCSNCGSNHDRDINAAINIRNSGMDSPGELAELSPIGETMTQEPMSKINSNVLLTLLSQSKT